MQSLSIGASLVTSFDPADSSQPIIISPTTDATTITVTESNTEILLPTGGLSTSIIQLDVPNIDNVFLDFKNRIATQPDTTKDVEISSGFTINRDINQDNNIMQMRSFSAKISAN